MEEIKYLTRRAYSEKILLKCINTAFSIAKNPKYDGYQRGLASVVYKLFDKKTWGGTLNNDNISNVSIFYTNQLLENLRKEKHTFYRQYLGCWSCW